MDRISFNAACQAFVTRADQGAKELLAAARREWTWSAHPAMSSLGHMHREVYVQRRTKSAISEPNNEEGVSPSPDTMENLEDYNIPDEVDLAVAASHSDGGNMAVVHQSVAYSPTFQVPAFYFTVSDSRGSPLPLMEVLHTTLFHPHCLPRTESTQISLALQRESTQQSEFPLLAQGDHPVLGTLCWYLHPCETPAAMNELMTELGGAGDEEGRLLTWLDTWFLVLGSVINLGR